MEHGLLVSVILLTLQICHRPPLSDVDHESSRAGESVDGFILERLELYVRPKECARSTRGPGPPVRYVTSL